MSSQISVFLLQNLFGVMETATDALPAADRVAEPPQQQAWDWPALSSTASFPSPESNCSQLAYRHEPAVPPVYTDQLSSSSRLGSSLDYMTAASSQQQLQRDSLDYMTPANQRQLQHNSLDYMTAASSSQQQFQGSLDYMAAGRQQQQLQLRGSLNYMAAAGQQDLQQNPMAEASPTYQYPNISGKKKKKKKN
jgi:hypothetical protein